MLRQLLINHDEVGTNNVAGVEILVDEFAEIRARLGDHRVLQIGTELGIKFAIGIVI